jgi:hypothetical protein
MVQSRSPVDARIFGDLALLDEIVILTSLQRQMTGDAPGQSYKSSIVILNTRPGANQAVDHSWETICTCSRGGGPRSVGAQLNRSPHLQQLAAAHAGPVQSAVIELNHPITHLASRVSCPETTHTCALHAQAHWMHSSRPLTWPFADARQRLFT